MHHEGFVEARMFDGVAAVANVNERRLRQRGQQLVGGVRGEQGRPLVFGRIAEHRVPAGIERVEARIGVPGLVEMQPVDRVPGDLDHALDVVDKAVVGRVRDDGMTRLGPVGALYQRVLLAVLAQPPPAAGLPGR